MVTLKKIGKGIYKAYRQTHSTSNHHGKSEKKTYRDWWGVRNREGTDKGILGINSINTPPELVGKKIEIYVRIKK